MSLTDRPELRHSFVDLDQDDHRDERPDELGADPDVDQDADFLETLLRSDDLVIDITENRIDLLPPRDTELERLWPTALVAPAAPSPQRPSAPWPHTEPDSGPDTGGETDLAGPDIETAEVTDPAGHAAPTTEPAADRDEPVDQPTRARFDEGRHDDDRARPLTGMRLRRVRLRSVASVAALFFIVAYLSVVGTGVVLWNAALRLGLITDTENLVTTALGLDTFDVSGAQLFEVLAMGAGVLCLLGLLAVVLVAVVYNVAGSLFGGLAFETAPLTRDSGSARRPHHSR